MKLHRCAALVLNVVLPADAIGYNEEGGDTVAHFFKSSF
jgi:hypothetical protein